MSPRETEQRAFALIGAALAGSPADIDALTEDLDLDGSRQLLRAFSIMLARDFRKFCPDPDIARELITQATIRAALGQ